MTLRMLPRPRAAIVCRNADIPPRPRELFQHRWMSFAEGDDDKTHSTQDGETAREQTDHADLKLPRSPLRVEVVGIAMSAADADALVSAHRPDFVTMDISIKGDIDGIAAASDIFVRYGVRSIFVSAYGDLETRTRAETANPIGWVRKPIDIAALGEAVHRVRHRDN